MQRQAKLCFGPQDCAGWDQADGDSVHWAEPEQVCLVSFPAGCIYLGTPKTSSNPHLTFFLRFTDDKCTKVATGESAPDPSYDTGYICPQHTSGWCGAAYSYLWVSPGTPIPGNCPAPAPPTSNEPAISVGAFQCIRSCVDKGNYLWMRSGVIQSTGVLTVQCSGQSTSSCGWFSDAACTKVVPGETGGGDSGIVCNQVLTGWCEAGWDVLALNSTQQSCSFVTTSVNPSAATTTRTGTATAVPSSTAAPVSTSSKPSAGTKSTAISFFVSAVVGLALVLVTFA